MALNPITYTEKVVSNFLRYQLTTYVMTLKFLAPAIQERIALLPQSYEKDPITEKQLRRIAMIPEWALQQEAFG